MKNKLTTEFIHTSVNELSTAPVLSGVNSALENLSKIGSKEFQVTAPCHALHNQWSKTEQDRLVAVMEAQYPSQ
jgi:hypothetical protein